MGSLFLLEPTVFGISDEHVPVPGAIATKITIQGCGELVGVYILVENSRSGFQWPTANELQISVRRGEIDAEWIVRIQGADKHIVRDRITAAVTNVERFRCALGSRLTVGVAGLEVEADVIRQAVHNIGVKIGAAIGCLQVIEPRSIEIEPVCIRKGVVITAIR